MQIFVSTDLMINLIYFRILKFQLFLHIYLNIQNALYSLKLSILKHFKCFNYLRYFFLFIPVLNSVPTILSSIVSLHSVLNFSCLYNIFYKFFQLIEWMFSLQFYFYSYLSKFYDYVFLLNSVLFLSFPGGPVVKNPPVATGDSS